MDPPEESPAPPLLGQSLAQKNMAEGGMEG